MLIQFLALSIWINGYDIQILDYHEKQLYKMRIALLGKWRLHYGCHLFTGNVLFELTQLFYNQTSYSDVNKHI